MGMISVVTCGCNFAILGVVAGYSVRKFRVRKIKNSMVQGDLPSFSGGIISMATIGALFGYAGNVITTSFGNYWKIAAGLIAILFGLYSMNLLPFRLPGFSIKSNTGQQGILTAILFGLAIGGLSAALNSCCNPLFPVILAASFVKGSAVWGLMMLTVFAFGYGLPLAAAIIGLGLGLGKISKTLTVVSKVITYIGRNNAGSSRILFSFNDLGDGG
jgi:cytochrome c-type biogenesis protein